MYRLALRGHDFNTGSVEKIWKWDKKDLIPEELKNRFLLAKNERKRTAWQVAEE